jgi:hypothetical protein
MCGLGTLPGQQVKESIFLDSMNYDVGRHE